MKFNIILTAVAASALMSGVAVAQATDNPAPNSTMQSGKSMPMQKTDPTMMPSGKTMPMDKTDPTMPAAGSAMPMPPTTTETNTAPTADTGGATSTSVTASDPATGSMATSTMVTNGPVADTAENRAKYGGPMSRAGKRSAPKGN